MSYNMSLVKTINLGDMTFNYYSMLAAYFGKDSISTLNGMTSIDAASQLDECIRYFNSSEDYLISLCKSSKHYKNCLHKLEFLSRKLYEQDSDYIFYVSK